QRRLPDEHLRAPKRGFVGPTAAWLRNELRGMIQDELAPARLQRLGYFDPTVVRGLLDDHFSRRHNRAGILWALLCFSIWHRGYVEAAPVAPLDPEAFAHAVRAVLQHGALRRRLGIEGRHTVERHYRWDGIGESMLPLYRSLYEATTRQPTSGCMVSLWPPGPPRSTPPQTDKI